MTEADDFKLQNSNFVFCQLKAIFLIEFRDRFVFCHLTKACVICAPDSPSDEHADEDNQSC